MKLVIQFGHATEATTVDAPVPNPFVPHRDDPPGIRYEWLYNTNAYLKVYNRSYVSEGVLWRLKTVKVGTMLNGQVGGATNRHPITHLTNVIFSAQSLNRENWHCSLATYRWGTQVRACDRMLILLPMPVREEWAGTMTNKWPSVSDMNASFWWTKTWNAQFLSNGVAWQLFKITLEDHAVTEQWHREDVTLKSISSK
jgi:hypothetical protein